MLDSTKIATVAHSNQKHEQHKPTFWSKNPRIIAWKLNLEWELSLFDLDKKMTSAG